MNNDLNRIIKDGHSVYKVGVVLSTLLFFTIVGIPIGVFGIISCNKLLDSLRSLALIRDNDDSSVDDYKKFLGDLGQLFQKVIVMLVLIIIFIFFIFFYHQISSPYSTTSIIS